MIKNLNIKAINQNKNIEKIKLDVRKSPTKIKKVKLNYVSACKRTPPVERIPVPSSHMEALNRSIRQKCEQNQRERIASYEKAKNFIVR